MGQKTIIEQACKVKKCQCSYLKNTQLVYYIYCPHITWVFSYITHIKNTLWKTLPKKSFFFFFSNYLHYHVLITGCAWGYVSLSFYLAKGKCTETLYYCTMIVHKSPVTRLRSTAMRHKNIHWQSDSDIYHWILLRIFFLFIKNICVEL